MGHYNWEEPSWFIQDMQQLEDDLAAKIISVKEFNDQMKEIQDELYESQWAEDDY